MKMDLDIFLAGFPAFIPDVVENSNGKFCKVSLRWRERGDRLMKKDIVAEHPYELEPEMIRWWRKLYCYDDDIKRELRRMYIYFWASGFDMEIKDIESSAFNKHNIRWMRWRAERGIAAD